MKTTTRNNLIFLILSILMLATISNKSVAKPLGIYCLYGDPDFKVIVYRVTKAKLGHYANVIFQSGERSAVPIEIVMGCPSQ